MKDNKQEASSLTRREALRIGLGTLLGTALAVHTRATEGTRAADATGQERLAISFWIWALWGTGPNRIVNDFEVRVAEAVERGYNCLRIEGGAGITHDAEGRPRGELEFYPVLPGHDLLTRGQQHMTGGRVDLLKRLIELCTVAKRYDVKLILSSWYYLHTFWFTDKNVTAELLGLPLEKRFMYFARGLDRILDALKQRGLADTIATAEIFNEVSPRYHGKTVDHEEALDFLQTRHPDIRFSLDTDSFDTSRIPRNAQVWTYHSYYLWHREHGLVGAVPRTNSGPEDPVWHEYPERLQRANAVFLGEKP